jgi:hypothetical protein
MDETAVSLILLKKVFIAKKYILFEVLEIYMDLI